ncbi:hypothetical protein [Aquimarina litoralis]|uniref:hypothetical protein n=1 Tax=Aquimarina litoralis TaxID=584605 RepID=UPI001C592525|nr:hypothetical protein [Aquimarina litoralis]MBW1297851.1 hypothetical protein [Aquimarina litoralis]
MNKEKINKNVNEQDLNLINESIVKLSKELNDLGLKIFNNETNKNVLSTSSHYVFSIIHRAIELNRGFISLTSTNNWITATNLIRLQCDNCIRLYALSLVKDRASLYDRIINGEYLKNIEDAEGNKMTDFYLSNKLDKLFPGFRLLYENTSGFIHFSKEHINFSSDKTIDDQNFVLKIRLSEITEIPIAKKVDYSYNMFIVGKELFKLLKGYKLHMEDLIKKLN